MVAVRRVRFRQHRKAQSREPRSLDGLRCLGPACFVEKGGADQPAPLLSSPTMRILHVIAEMALGGAERVVLQLLADARAYGDTTGLACAPGGRLLLEAVALGARQYEVPLQRRSAVATMRGAGKLRRAIEDFRPDVIHTHNVRATVATRVALIGLGSKAALLTSVQGLDPGDYRAASRLLRFTTSHVIACSPSVARSLASAGFPPAWIDVIHNAAHLAPADDSRMAALRERFLIGERPLVVGLGRLMPQKSWSTLIEAASHLEGVDIVVAGEGELRAPLERAAHLQGDRVRFIGPVSDVAALLGLASCVVSTSTWEGLPLALLEALSLGVPAVATAVDGVRDVVSPDAAMLVEPGDPGAVADAISRVLAEPGLARRLSEAGMTLSRSWTPQAMVLRYRAAYQAAVG